MTPTAFSLLSAFLLCVVGLSLHRTHFMSALLCIEGMMLTMFMLLAQLTTTQQSTILATSPIIILSFSACEAGMGLALLVATSRTHATDHLKNLSLLQC
uniref:NADH-ubiquinone oxidoreductase chain 4L n=1 Tax=Smaug warreni TaxID=885424 RepID=Q6I7W6_9SAUR|nr:NADH dehydrogenase subunit 4L [Smaug warreni]BAD24758.1 NADH dehydrogenase subunit 4L [Smaug warreni]